jgi:hypothetical protein
MVKTFCILYASAYFQAITIGEILDTQKAVWLFLFVTLILNTVLAFLLRAYNSLRRPLSVGTKKVNRKWPTIDVVEASAVFCLAAMLLTLVLPVVAQAREKARRATCRNSLRTHSGPCIRIVYRGKLQSGSSCPETLPDGTPYPTIYMHDVAWHESWGDLPQSDATTRYEWAKWYGCHPNPDGWYYGTRSYVSTTTQTVQ